ncbi:MAG: hypothetical protein KatS3mg109_0269 [Pirellulaceae bacterium]|nr:MAG: hypothetical protein KatS3mg109_0269 [Pirellulaceae bacterium]
MPPLCVVRAGHSTKAVGELPIALQADGQVCQQQGSEKLLAYLVDRLGSGQWQAEFALDQLTELIERPFVNDLLIVPLARQEFEHHLGGFTGAEDQREPIEKYRSDLPGGPGLPK